VSYVLQEALRAFRRTPLLTGLSAGMIGLSLFLVGLFGLAAFNIRRVLQQVESRVEVVAYLRDEADAAAVTAAQGEIAAWPEVREVAYITKEQALQRARRDLPELETVIGGLESNPLPASLEVMFKPNQTGPDVVRRAAERIQAFAVVEDVRFGSEWLDKVFLLRRVAGTTLLILGVAFATVAALIISSAIRMAIYARRDEIEIMRLVGATEGFVRRPFLLEGLITGVLGGLLALGAMYAAYSVVSRTVFPLEWLPVEWAAAGVLAGSAVGVLASGAAIRRHLREV
jgi:cell division transport system permease protein